MAFKRGPLLSHAKPQKTHPISLVNEKKTKVYINCVMLFDLIAYSYTSYKGGLKSECNHLKIQVVFHKIAPKYFFRKHQIFRQYDGIMECLQKYDIQDIMHFGTVHLLLLHHHPHLTHSKHLFKSYKQFIPSILIPMISIFTNPVSWLPLNNW